MQKLQGITWDHPRGLAPLVATSEDFTKQRADLSIAWDVRSLKAFGDQPVETLVHSYDLMMIDHPFIGTGVRKNILEPLDDYIPDDFFLDQRINSVGKSYQSYKWDGKHYALPADAASQVAAYRPDLMKKYGLEPPRTWQQFFEFHKQLPAGVNIGLPLVPTDAACTFLSLCAQSGGHDFISDSKETMDTGLAEEILLFMQQLSAMIHPESLQRNPIHMLDFMAESDEIIYVPYIFGYSNYSRHDFAGKQVQFTNIPSYSDTPDGAILGGVGISISAFSEHKQAAADYISYVMKGEVQKGRYVEAGGQPGYRGAWTDPAVNASCNHYFLNTLPTLDHSFLRPRFPNYNYFQEKAGEIIHQFLKQHGDAKTTAGQLAALYQQVKREGEQ